MKKLGVLAIIATVLSVNASAEVFNCGRGNYTDNSESVFSPDCTPVKQSNLTVFYGDVGWSKPKQDKSKEETKQVKESEKVLIIKRMIGEKQIKLVSLQKSYDNPVRLGNEKNYQKYLDRMALMKTEIDSTILEINTLELQLKEEIAKEKEIEKK